MATFFNTKVEISIIKSMQCSGIWHICVSLLVALTLFCKSCYFMTYWLFVSFLQVTLNPVTRIDPAAVLLLCLQVLGKRIQSMGTTVAEIQRCKPDLCLPDGAEETLVVFSVVDQMQTLLLDLEKVGASTARSGD